MSPRAIPIESESSPNMDTKEGKWCNDEWHTDGRGSVIGGAPQNFVFVAKSSLAASEQNVTFWQEHFDEQVQYGNKLAEEKHAAEQHSDLLEGANHAYEREVDRLREALKGLVEAVAIGHGKRSKRHQERMDKGVKVATALQLAYQALMFHELDAGPRYARQRKREASSRACSSHAS